MKLLFFYAPEFWLKPFRKSLPEAQDAAGELAAERAVVALVIAILPNLPGFINAAANRTHALMHKANAAHAEAARLGMNADQIAAAVQDRLIPARVTPMFPEVFDTLYGFAWFIGLALGFGVYALLMKAAPPRASVSSAPAVAA